jgi:phage-related minor tail protein
LASGSVSGQGFGGFSGGSSFGIDTTGLQGPLKPFADGGIVRKPTAALIGEAGPEAVIPLSEMRNGGLGGGDVNVTTIVNANGQSTSTTEGNGMNKEQAVQLSRMVESTVVGVIQRERRPGGILSR